MTNEKGKLRKLGSRRWELAVAEAVGLTKVERAMCNALVPYVNWETGEATVGMQRLATGSGYRRRAIQLAGQSLEEKGVLAYPDGRRGGRGSNGRGIPNRTRMNLDVLEAMKGASGAPLYSAPGAPLKGANGDDQGRTPRPGRAQTATNKGALGAHKQLRDQPDEQQRRTTTTTNAAEAAAEGGGGGGASSTVGGRPEEGNRQGAEGGAPAPHDADESRRLLLEFGVSAPKARALSARFAPGVVTEGIKWVNSNAGDNTYSPAGLLVTALEDGTAAEAWQSKERQRIEREAAQAAEELHKWRCAVLDAVFDHLRQLSDPAIRAEAKQLVASIRKVWPTIDGLARACVVPDELLRAEEIDPNAVLDAACAAAARLTNPTNRKGTP